MISSKWISSVTFLSTIISASVIAADQPMVFDKDLGELCCHSISTDKEFEIPRTANAPTLDGYFEDGEWAAARVINDLHQVSPVEYSQPSESTVFRFMYDDDALYVAVYAYDSEPDEITATVSRQGAALWNDDRLVILLDPFNNDRSGYDFMINPNGVRSDSIYTSAFNAEA